MSSVLEIRPSTCTPSYGLHLLSNIMNTARYGSSIVFFYIFTIHKASFLCVKGPGALCCRYRFCLSKHRSVAVVEPPVIGSPEHVGNKMLRADVGQNRALVVADGAAARPVDDHNSGCDHACTPGSKTGAETTPRAAEGGGPLFIGRDKGSGITRICSEGARDCCRITAWFLGGKRSKCYP